MGKRGRAEEGGRSPAAVEMLAQEVKGGGGFLHPVSCLLFLLENLCALLQGYRNTFKENVRVTKWAVRIVPMQRGRRRQFVTRGKAGGSTAVQGGAVHLQAVVLVRTPAPRHSFVLRSRREKNKALLWTRCMYLPRGLREDL